VTDCLVLPLLLDDHRDYGNQGNVWKKTNLKASSFSFLWEGLGITHKYQMVGHLGLCGTLPGVWFYIPDLPWDDIKISTDILNLDHEKIKSFFFLLN